MAVRLACRRARCRAGRGRRGRRSSSPTAARLAGRQGERFRLAAPLRGVRARACATRWSGVARGRRGAGPAWRAARGRRRGRRSGRATTRCGPRATCGSRATFRPPALDAAALALPAARGGAPGRRDRPATPTLGLAFVTGALDDAGGGRAAARAGARRAVAPGGGAVVLAAAPADAARPGRRIWGSPPPALELMRSLKAASTRTAGSRRAGFAGGDLTWHPRRASGRGLAPRPAGALTRGRLRPLRVLPAGLPDLALVGRGDGLAARAHRPLPRAARRPARAGSAAVAEHFDRCLGCMACVTACPSGVRYDLVIEAARDRVERELRSGRSRTGSTARCVFALFPYPGRLRVAAVLLWLCAGQRAAAGCLRRLGAPAPLPAPRPARRAGAADRAPRGPARRLPGPRAGHGERRLRVGLVTGCVQGVFFPGVNAATVRVLAAEGVEVVVPRGAGLLRRALRARRARSTRRAAWPAALIERFEARRGRRWWW